MADQYDKESLLSKLLDEKAIMAGKLAYAIYGNNGVVGQYAAMAFRSAYFALIETADCMQWTWQNVEKLLWNMNEDEDDESVYSAYIEERRINNPESLAVEYYDRLHSPENDKNIVKSVTNCYAAYGLNIYCEQNHLTKNGLVKFED